MVRAPAKSCPNLSRLFDDTEAALLSGFLDIKSFERLNWLAEYRFDPSSPDGINMARNMLKMEKKERLNPLETEAARIVTISSARGQFALERLARTKLESDRAELLMNNRDELARSLWAYLHEHALFEAAENSLHLRLYRRYDRHYQTFLVDSQQNNDADSRTTALDALLADLSSRLDRGEGYDIERFDLPEDGSEPAAEMYLLFHPDPPTSVREIDDDGNRSRFYFRPPGEAMIVYTPLTGRVHVRAASRNLRHAIAESFSQTVLDQPLSNQPVDFQAYDISRFFNGFDLELPEFDDVSILRAQVIRTDISIGNLANRLSVSTSVNQDIGELITEQPGLDRIFRNALAVRFVEIAVQYRPAGSDKERTLDFTLTDRNTSSLLSLDDAFERVLGHRLLRAWGILREGRAPTPRESMAVLPALLALWNSGTDRISGAWLLERGTDVATLIDLGFLVPAGWEGDDLIDDDDLGQQVVEVVVRPGGLDLRPSEGQSAPVGSAERYRVYRVRDGWVTKHLIDELGGALDVPAMEEIRSDLYALGTLETDGRDVPIYLARGLEDERVRAAIDTELRARDKEGIGLVLQAGDAAGSCLAANVLARLVDHILPDATEIALDLTSVTAAYRRNRNLARGGATVQFDMSGESAGVLSVPGKGTIDIVGANRVKVIDRLVRAHHSGPASMKTEDMIEGFERQSLANIFGQPLWDKLKADFLRSPKRGQWEIAV